MIEFLEQRSATLREFLIAMPEMVRTSAQSALLRNIASAFFTLYGGQFTFSTQL